MNEFLSVYAMGGWCYVCVGEEKIVVLGMAYMVGEGQRNVGDTVGAIGALSETAAILIHHQQQ